MIIPTKMLKEKGYTDEEIAMITAGNDWIFLGKELGKHSEGIFDTWVGLAYEDPPEDILGRVLWSVGVIGQLILSLMTFPAGMGLFLLEESMQTMGMGAFILSQTREWDALANYVPFYYKFIDHTEGPIKNLATISPITGQAVLMYRGAALQAAAQFGYVARTKLKEAIAEEEEKGKRIEFERTHGELRLSSTPTDADIYMNGEFIELTTLETFSDMEEGTYDFELRRYSVRREVWDIYAFSIEITGGMRKEIHVRIPHAVVGEEEAPEDKEESEEKKLEKWIKAQVMGDYAIDGDTFVTDTGERIRVLGIDAPEKGRPLAEEATTMLDDEVIDKNISLKIPSSIPIDTYGRTLAIVRNYKGRVGISLISAGLARYNEPTDIPWDWTAYERAEEAAKTRKIGIWS